MKWLKQLYTFLTRFFVRKPYKRIATFRLEEVLPFVLHGPELTKLHNSYQALQRKTPTELEWHNFIFRDYCGQLINMNAPKFVLYAKKGTNCIHCGARGAFFALEKARKDSFAKYQLNLYAINAQGKEVLMTKDHIIPLSKGGSRRSLKNLQPMCITCNQIKSNKIESNEKEKLS